MEENYTCHNKECENTFEYKGTAFCSTECKGENYRKTKTLGKKYNSIKDIQERCAELATKYRKKGHTNLNRDIESFSEV